MKINIDKMRLKELEDEIKMFELERIENDITNTGKLDALYELYYKHKNEIESN